MRRAARAALALILAPVLAVALWLLAGFAGAVIPGPVAVVSPGAGVQRVGLVAGPIHYDFLLPLTDGVRDRFAFAEVAGVPVRHSGAEWLIVGWGAREFYTSTETLADMAPSTVLQAATGDAAVMRLDVIGPVAAGAAVTWLALSGPAFDALVAAIAGDAGAVPLPARALPTRMRSSLPPDAFT